MQGNYLIEVSHKPGVKDPAGEALASSLSELRLPHIARVASSQLYRLSGNVSAPDRARIMRDLLCDPTVQDSKEEAFTGRASPPKPWRRWVKGEGKMKGRCMSLDLWYKPSVTDVVGESVAKGIRDLDLSGVENVRTGARYRFWGARNEAEVHKIALTLLVNPLIQEYQVYAD